MQGTAAPAHFRARLAGSKIRIDAPVSESIEAFLHTLPACVWDRRDLCWKCNATPAAAWRLLYGEVRFDGDAELFALASSIQEAQIVGTGGVLMQPGFRKNDLWRHQLEAFRFAKNLPAAMLHMGMGCVSADTEYLSPNGWKPIGEYSGGLVAQFEPETGKARFVSPEYVKFPCEKMWEFRHSRGMSQILSDDHRVLWYDHKNRPRFNYAEDIAAGLGGTKHAKFLAAFELENETSLGLGEDRIRLMVAVIADGHFASKTNYCRINIKKQRKIDRLHSLLKKLNIEPKVKVQPDGFHVFHFYAPLREKEYGSRWWSCNLEERRIIADECVHWDDSERKAGAVSFFSRVKKSAEFIQYCFASTGRRASIREQVRTGGIDYTVLAVGEGRSGNYINFALKNGNVSRVPSPDGYKYCFRVPSGALVLRHNGHIFTTGNCGKSATTISLIANKACRKVLICCPKSVLGVWRREFEKHCPTAHKVVVLEKGTTTDKKKLLDKELMLASALQAPRITVFVVNYETARMPVLAEALAEVKFDCVVCDESQRIKAHNSQQSKALAAIGATAKYRLALTGTPMQNSPMDVFGQFRFLDPGVFGTKYHAFRSRYAETGHFGADHIVGFKNQEELAARMRLLTYHADRSVLDLPPVQHITVPVTLGQDTLKLYRALEQEMIAAVADEVVTVSNALVKTLRLRQITGGFVHTDDDGAGSRLVETGHEKRDALVELLEGMDAPCVVFCEFVHDLDQIADAAREAGRKYGEVSGRRKDLTQHATMPEDVGVMGVQVRSGGIGVDLTRAPYGVFWNHPWSPGLYDQAWARVSRPGQTQPCVFYHLLAEGTADVQVWKALEKKQNVIDMVIAYMRGME